jgi:hypothetical protein
MKLLKETLKFLLGWLIAFSAIPLYFTLLVANVLLTFHVNGLICVITALASITAVILLLGLGINLILEAKIDD